MASGTNGESADDGSADDDESADDESAAGDRESDGSADSDRENHGSEAAQPTTVPGIGADGVAGDEQSRRCDHCRLPIPGEPITVDHDGQSYRYCSTACREEVEESDRVFTQFHGFRRAPTGVSPIDESLPQGIPRNSLVLLTDLAGTRTEAVQAELVWRALQRGEPAVFVSFLEPPISVVQEFVTLDWNVIPYLESGQLQILDCFTYRLENRDRMYDRFNDWNRYLSSVVDGATSRVRDPSEIGELQNRIDDVLESRDMVDRGIVVVDSLTEFGTLVQPVQSYKFLKDLRAEVPKSRFVPVFAGATVTGDNEGFPHDLGYVVDGIVEMRLNDDLVEGSLLKQMRVRKMSGVLNLPKWVLYEYTAGEGIVTIELHEGPPDADESDGPDAEPESGEAASPDGQTADSAAARESAPAEPEQPSDGTAVDPGDAEEN